MLSELAEGTCAWMRSLFVDLCGYVFGIFSRAFFKDRFFEPLLDLGRVSLQQLLGAAELRSV